MSSLSTSFFGYHDGSWSACLRSVFPSLNRRACNSCGPSESCPVCRVSLCLVLKGVPGTPPVPSTEVGKMLTGHAHENWGSHVFSFFDFPTFLTLLQTFRVRFSFCPNETEEGDDNGGSLGMTFSKRIQEVLTELPVEELCPFIHAFEYNPPPLSPVTPPNDPLVSDVHLTLGDQTPQVFRTVRLSNLWQMCRRHHRNVSAILGGQRLQKHPFFEDFLLGLNVTWVLEKVRQCVPEKSFYFRMLLVLSLIDPELSLLKSSEEIYPQEDAGVRFRRGSRPLLNMGTFRISSALCGKLAHALMRLVALWNNKACACARVQWLGTRGGISGATLTNGVLCAKPERENSYLQVWGTRGGPFEMCVRLGHTDVLAPFLTGKPESLVERRASLGGLSLFQAACKGANPGVLRYMINMMPPEICRQALESKTTDGKGLSVFHICCSTPTADGDETFDELYNAAEELGIDIHSLRDKTGRSVFYACPTTSISYLEKLKKDFDRERDIELVGVRSSLFHFFFPEHLNPIPSTVRTCDGLVSPLFLVGQIKVKSTKDSNSEVRAAYLLIERGADPSVSMKGKGPWFLWMLQGLLKGWSRNRTQTELDTLLASVRGRIDANRASIYLQRDDKEREEEGVNVNLTQASLRQWVASLRAESVEGERNIWRQAFEFLLAEGGQVYPENRQSSHVLLNELTLQHPEVTRMMLQRGADPSVADAKGRNALARVIGGNGRCLQKVGVCNALLGVGPDTQSRDPDELKTLWEERDAEGKSAVDVLPSLFIESFSSDELLRLTESLLDSNVEITPTTAELVATALQRDFDRLPIDLYFSVRNRLTDIVHEGAMRAQREGGGMMPDGAGPPHSAASSANACDGEEGRE
uniref:Uncharacterized protein n=1 Tax=Chromera velia CCMP2878 TaxID=1169474 RepID=A0A0G4FSN7_9ALVE|eukprot:Cvel_18577.t1-p1 / transcript=Cvel_18577.t1 / gene=Cvel_18577 / organism=Chromera_velia_CCMP2878 / gene_product=hypothetical protein / transcript_product=hypothetical protein / location=Cvel_scaffold1549:2788-5556(+) / protein_length=867 / sequence_SO=supercontig / SO=protein_coding / is_pseudo=false